MLRQIALGLAGVGVFGAIGVWLCGRKKEKVDEKMIVDESKQLQVVVDPCFKLFTSPKDFCDRYTHDDHHNIVVIKLVCGENEHFNWIKYEESDEGKIELNLGNFNHMFNLDIETTAVNKFFETHGKKIGPKIKIHTEWMQKYRLAAKEIYALCVPFENEFDGLCCDIVELSITPKID